MKLYIDKIKPTNINACGLNDTIKHTKSVKTIISEDGIFRVLDKAVERVEITDVPIIHTKIGEVDGIIDKSTMTCVEKTSHVPTSHCYSEWLYHYYSLRPKAVVKFVLGENNGTIEECYFDINTTEITEPIKEDIHAFLTKLKFC